MKEFNSWNEFYATAGSESDLFMTERENKSFNLIAGQKCRKFCGNENDCLKDQDSLRIIEDFLKIIIRSILTLRPHNILF
jgi:hypothetical protein